MRIIFLDFDGVLNSTPFLSANLGKGWKSAGEAEALDPANVERLERLVRETAAAVVISSSWRHGRNLPSLCAILASRGFTGRVIGKTPDFVPNNDELSKRHCGERGDEYPGVARPRPRLRPRDHVVHHPRRRERHGAPTRPPRADRLGHRSHRRARRHSDQAARLTHADARHAQRRDDCEVHRTIQRRPRAQMIDDCRHRPLRECPHEVPPPVPRNVRQDGVVPPLRRDTRPRPTLLEEALLEGPTLPRAAARAPHDERVRHPPQVPPALRKTCPNH